MKRSIRSSIAVVSAAAMLIGVTACGNTSSTSADGPPTDGGTLKYAIAIQPPAGGIDPVIASSIAGQHLMDQAYEPLLSKDEAGKIQPELAVSYSQEDETTYRFQLREGVKFADGSAFDADDVVYSFEQYMKSTSGKAAYLPSLKSAKKLDEYSVELTLNQADSTFVNALANRELFLMVSSDGYAKASKEDREKRSYGTGPFVLTDWQDGVSMTFEKNDEYWAKDQPRLDGIEFRIIPDDSTRLAAVQQGSVDAASFTDGVTAKQAAFGNWTLGKTYSTQALPIFINPTSGPLKDKKVRQAVSLALNRDVLIKTAQYGDGEVSYAAPAGDPAAPAVTDSTPNYQRNLDKAKQLLQEAETPHPTIELSYFGDTSQSQHPIYELMQQQLSDVGIKVSLKAKSTSELSPIFTSGQSFDGLVSLPWSYKPDPTFYYDSFLSENGALNQWKDNPDAAKAMELLAEAKKETDEDKKARLIQDLADNVAEEALVIVPMAVPSDFEVWNQDVLKDYSTDYSTSRIALRTAWMSQ
ncbi:ABC-type transport system, substrate-binding protein [Brevibacterium sp. 239c]|uniref:ABC transporter substrate-binding protein n=1 Tax=Brevibacterium sp. 239c TaxID=1965356 RepID=UPI000C4DC435|nr:ABC transporter substrate-binding protein [Brevibacterium sp. 239c]SMX94885.1 ABC-type transport system, substrate-binding protein [Brevibacterium sp. 239c]